MKYIIVIALLIAVGSFQAHASQKKKHVQAAPTSESLKTIDRQPSKKATPSNEATPSSQDRMTLEPAGEEENHSLGEPIPDYSDLDLIPAPAPEPY